MRFLSSKLVSGLLIAGLIATLGCESSYMRSYKLYKQQNNLPKAKEQLEAGTKATPNDAALWLELGRLNGDMDNYAEMNTALKKAAELNPAMKKDADEVREFHWNKHYSKGANLFNEKKTDDAMKSFDTACKIDETKALSQSGMGAAYIEKNDFEKAASYLLKASELDPNDMNTLYRLDFVYGKLNQGDKRMELNQKILVKDPNNVTALQNLAAAYDEMNQDDKAIEYYEKVVMNPEKAKDVNVWFNLGVLYDTKKNYTEAARCFGKARDISPDDVDVLYNLGLVQSRSEQFDAALETANKYIQVKPSAPDGYRLRGSVYRAMAEKFQKSGDEKKSAEYLNKTTEDFKKAQELSGSGS